MTKNTKVNELAVMLTKEEAIDEISDVLSDIYEMDTPWWRYATRVVEHLTARGVMFVRKSDDPADPPTT